MKEHTYYSEHKAFYRGDLVRVRMTPEIVGQVIGENNWGETYLVRLGGSTEINVFHDVELEPYKARGAGGHDEEPEKGSGLPPHIDNIIDLERIRARGRA